MKQLLILPAFLFVSILNGFAQEMLIQSKIIGVDQTPVSGAVISVSGNKNSVITDDTGLFKISTPNNQGTLKIKAEGFYPYELPLNSKNMPESIRLISEKSIKYQDGSIMPFGMENRDSKSSASVSIEKKTLGEVLTVDAAMQDELPGLRVINKGGMPGEGAYLNLRGIHSLVAENNPLIVINGIPHLGNTSISPVINGYSRGLLSSFNLNDIKSISVIKGSAAAIYGSLGSNGVILIETEQAQSDNLETRISFSGQYGLHLSSRNIPVLGVSDYKDYLRNIGMTRYDKMSSLYSDYPFLQNNEDYYYNYLFNNTTNWQKEISNNALVSDNVFRVEGGDEIAKYNISTGYTTDGGVLGKTKTDRYNTLINANILVNRKVDIFTTIGLAYIQSDLQEQGMYDETNALLASYYSMPMLSPYKKDGNGNTLKSYATYDFANVNANPHYPYENVSNALAIVNTMKVEDKIYDVNIQMGLNYRPAPYWTITGLMNLYYNYTEESMFIPGVTDRAILPQYYTIGNNTVRKGITESKSMYYGIQASYNRTINDIHELKGTVGSRMMTRKLENDAAAGYNTANDFYQTLGYITDEHNIYGNNNEWIWTNHYMHGDYTYNHLLKTSFNLAIDGSSVSGVDTRRYGIFPSGGLTFMAANSGILPSFVNRLNLSAEYGLTGNSRFSSNFAKNYYQSSNYFTLGTITRSNVPNTRLQWEKSRQLDLGLDFSTLQNRLDIGFNYYQTNSYDLLFAKNISAVYGSTSYYDNTAEIQNQGIEASLRVLLVKTKDFEWTVGGNISTVKSKVLALGNQKEAIIKFSGYNNNDDAQVILRTGCSPYQFYGYKTNGIYTTTPAAENATLTNIYGKASVAGDVRFIDNYVDQKLNEKDRDLLGSALPDFFGGFYHAFRYKSFTLTTEFGYSVGNMAYNAVRRRLESMSNFYNQTEAVLNRWQVEGQNTDMPRAAYGDPSGNNIFSDRWIEDASYLKLRSVTLSYNFDQSILNFFRSGMVYITGENLLTVTNYLGSDPEFSYSYDESIQGFDYGKVGLPRTVKVGFNLKF